MTLTVQTLEALVHVSQRVLCWAKGDEHLIQTNSAAGGRLALTIPDTVMQRHGPLYLKSGGPDIVAMNKDSLFQSANVGNGDVLSVAPGKCGGPEIVMTMAKIDDYTWSCSAPSGTVIKWGDGTTSTSYGTPYTHRYQEGKYQMVLTKDGVSQSTWMVIPSNVGLLSMCPAPPTPVTPTVTGISPACHWGWDNFTMTVTGTQMTLATVIELVQLGELRSLTNQTATSAKVTWGEIEYNGPGDVVSDVRVYFNGFAPVTLTGAFRMRPPGNTC